MSNILHSRNTGVSQELFTKLEMAFPQLDHNYITTSTTLIDVHRKAAQQEVLDYIAKACPSLQRNRALTNTTLWYRLRRMLYRRE